MQIVTEIIKLIFVLVKLAYKLTLLAIKLILFLAKIPFVMILSRIGNLSGRVRSGNLQTPVISYLHRQTGKTAIVIGVIHIGPKGYYSELQGILDEAELDGFAVLYEKTGKLTTAQKTKLTAEECTLAKKIENMSMLTKNVQHLFGYVSQFKHITIKKSWINTDTTTMQVIQQLSAAGYTLSNYRSIRELFSKNISGKWQNRLRWLIRFMIREGVGHTMFKQLTLGHIFDRNKRIWQQIVIDQRNSIAVAGIISHNTKSNVVSLWGAGHLPGIDSLLQNSGYTRAAVEWVDYI